MPQRHKRKTGYAEVVHYKTANAKELADIMHMAALANNIDKLSIQRCKAIDAPSEFELKVTYAKNNSPLDYEDITIRPPCYFVLEDGLMRIFSEAEFARMFETMPMPMSEPTNKRKSPDDDILAVLKFFEDELEISRGILDDVRSLIDKNATAEDIKALAQADVTFRRLAREAGYKLD